MKIDTSKLTPELITELCKEPNIKEFMINNGVVKSELEVGRWYKWFNDIWEGTKYDVILNVTKIENNEIFGYGFVNGKYVNECVFYSNHNYKEAISNLTEITPQEVETALKNEAVKIGFGKKGVTFTDIFGEKLTSDIDGFDFWNLRQKYIDVSAENKFNIAVCKNKGVIYSNGKWAEIIKEETYIKIPLSVITLTDSKKKLGKIVKNLAKNV
jgi:hypothetical protein